MNVFLRFISRIFRVDASYIMRGGFWLMLDQLVSTIIGFGLAIAFANLLPKEAYGEYRYVLSLFGILTIFTLPNMNIALSRAVARGFEGGLGEALRTRVRWGLIGAGISIAFAVWNFATGNTLIGASALIIGFALPLTDSLNVYTAYLEGKKLFKAFALSSIVLRLISAAALVAVMIFTKSLIVLLTGFFVPFIAVRFFFLWRTYRNFHPGTQVEPGMVTYGKHLSVIQIMNVFVNYLDSLLIFHYLGAVALAVYSIAMSPVSKAQIGFSVISDLALPKLANKSREESTHALLPKIFRAMALMGFFVLVYIFATPFLFHIAFPKYPEAVQYSQWLSLIWLSFPFSIIYTLLQAQGDKKRLYIYNVVIRMVQLVLVVGLVTTLGIGGAVAARILFQLASIVTLLVLFARFRQTPSSA